MFCINCGKKLQDGALFCDQCGRRISGAGECEPGTQPVQQQYSPYYGAHRNNVSANYEERKAKRAVCNFVIFRTFVYVFLILYTIATRFDFIYSCMGIEASVRQVESLWQEIGGKVTFWGVFVIILLLSYMVLVAMLAYNESFSKKHSFTQFKGMLTGDIFEGIVLIILRFLRRNIQNIGRIPDVLPGKVLPGRIACDNYRRGNTPDNRRLPVKVGYRYRECPKNQSDYCQAVRNSQRHYGVCFPL